MVVKVITQHCFDDLQQGWCQPLAFPTLGIQGCIVLVRCLLRGEHAELQVCQLSASTLHSVVLLYLCKDDCKSVCWFDFLQAMYRVVPAQLVENTAQSVGIYFFGEKDVKSITSAHEACDLRNLENWDLIWDGLWPCHCPPK